MREEVEASEVGEVGGREAGWMVRDGDVGEGTDTWGPPEVPGQFACGEEGVGVREDVDGMF
jgi:hypothetical protein